MESEIHTKLKELVNGRGVRRSSLYKDLGVELRKALSVAPGSKDDPAGVQQTVEEQLEWLVQTLDNANFSPQDRDIARASFNISIPEIAGLDLTRRREWLETAPRPYMAASRRTAQRHLGRIIAHFARQLDDGESLLARREVMATTSVDSGGTPGFDYDRSTIVEEQAAAANTSEGQLSQGAASENPPPPRRLSLSRRQWLGVSATACVVVLLLAIASAVAIQTNWPRKSGMPRAIASPSEPPSASVSASVNAGPAKTSPPANALRLTPTMIKNVDHGFVFPIDKGDAAAPFVNQREYPDNEAKFMEAGLKAGAYAIGTLSIHVNAAAVVPREVTIYNIRLAEFRNGAPIAGSLVSLGTGGGVPTSQMAFVLNERNQGPFTLDELENPTKRLYFNSEVIKVASGKGDTVVIHFQPREGSRTPPQSYFFRLAFDFEVDGAKHTTVLDNEGQPFRITDGVCRYASVTQSTNVKAPLEKIDPEAFVSGDCPS